MNDLSWLARQINVAADDKDKAALQVWTQKCRDMLDRATDVERVILRYYEAYALAGIGVVKSTQSSYASEWDQPEAIAEILALRQAINEPAFDEAQDALRHRVQTNLGICLNKLGRPIAAIEQWDRVLRHNQKFAMALGHRARGISRYAGSLYDLNHALVLFNAARSDYDKALSETAEWDEDEHSLASPTFRDGRDEIDHYLKKFDFDDNYDLNQWSIGDSENERHYRRWCLHKRLFLTPLNDVTTLSCAASDVLHLPDHRYKVGEVPRFVGLYNLLKQEYVGSRYHLYCAMNERAFRFLNDDVKLFDIADGSVYGHHTEELKSAFRSGYAIFDKVGLFLNDYYAVGLKPGKVSFRKVWSEDSQGAGTYQLRQAFVGKDNWPLLGLYSLSKDLFDGEFQDVAEPDAARLSELRNQIEHRFLSLHYFGQGMPAGTVAHEYVPLERFQENSLRMLRLARESLIYLSLAMHQEESIRRGHDDDPNEIIPSVGSREIETDELI